MSIASKLLNYCKDLVSGCSVNQPFVDNMQFYLSQIELYETETKLNDTLDKLIVLTKNTSLYHLLLTIPCVKENLASRCVAEKGNKHLRTIIYLIVQQMTKVKNIDSSVKTFYKKKTQQGLPKLAAPIACSNKLIRIIYYMHKTGCAFM